MNARFKQSLIRFLIASVAISVFIRFTDFIVNDFKLDILIDFKAYLINFLYAFIIGMVNMVCFSVIYRKFEWYRDARKIIVIGVVGSVIWSTLAFFLARFLHFVVIEGVSFDYFITSEVAVTYVFAMLIAFLVTLIFHAIYFYKALQESKIKEQKFKYAQTTAQYDALKNQLDPHFLFNSLNVLTALIDENPSKAQEFTAHLSRIYRYILDHKHQELVPLNAEIEFARRYIKLIEMRFENSVNFKIDLNLKSQLQVIPLSLQLLIENAIKHNKISEQSPLFITIDVKDRQLVVSNNKQLKHNSNSRRNGIGLENIKQRVARFTNAQVEIITEEDSFTVKIPLIA